MRRIMLVVLVLFSTPVFAGEHILNPMLGVTDWSRNGGHTAAGSNLAFNNDNSLSLGFKYLYRFDNGLAIGGSIVGYRKTVKTTSLAHKAYIANTNALLEYYFNSQASTSPYIGFGLGGMGIGFDGGSLDGDSSAGHSIQLNAGLLHKFSERYGIQFEYQYNTFDVNDDIHNSITNIETYSHSLLIGLTIHL